MESEFQIPFFLEDVKDTNGYLEYDDKKFLEEIKIVSGYIPNSAAFVEFPFQNAFSMAQRFF